MRRWQPGFTDLVHAEFSIHIDSESTTFNNKKKKNDAYIIHNKESLEI